MHKITSTLFKWVMIGCLVIAPMAIVPIAVMPTTAWAQGVSAEALADDIKRLRRDLRDLQQLMLQKSGNNDAVERIKTDVSGSVYEQMNTLDATVGDVAKRLENIEGDSLGFNKKFEKLSKDLEFRLQQLSDQLGAVSEKVDKGEKVDAVSQDVVKLNEIVMNQQALIKSQAEALQRQTEAIEQLTAQVKTALENSNKAMSNSDTAVTNSNQALANLEAVSKTTADVAKALKVKQTKAKVAKATKTEPTAKATKPAQTPDANAGDKSKTDQVAKADTDKGTKKAPEKTAEKPKAPQEPLDTTKVAGRSADLQTQYDTPQAHYKKAVDFMSSDKLADAEVLFMEFINQYPNDESVDDAKYQYARLLMLRGQNASAGKLFTDIYENHPKSNRRPDSLVELARLYKGAGNVNNACAILQVFKDQFTEQKTSRSGRYATRLYKDYNCKKSS